MKTLLALAFLFSASAQAAVNVKVAPFHALLATQDFVIDSAQFRLACAWKGNNGDSKDIIKYSDEYETLQVQKHDEGTYTLTLWHQHTLRGAHPFRKLRACYADFVFRGVRTSTGELIDGSLGHSTYFEIPSKGMQTTTVRVQLEDSVLEPAEWAGGQITLRFVPKTQRY